MLYGKETQKALINFPISGITMPKDFIHSLAIIKKACAVANHEVGKLDSKTTDAIKAAATEVISGQHDDQFMVDVFQTGSGTSTNMNMNEVLSQLCSNNHG
jgi:fumarate hydratase class II